MKRLCCRSKKCSSRTEESLFQQFGIVLPEHRPQRCRRPLRHGVNGLNQTISVRGHHQQIPRRSWPRIPIRMRRPSTYQYPRTRSRFDYVRPGADTQIPLQHIPGFIVVAVKVKRSNPARWTWRTTRILPLRDHKRIASGTENTPRERLGRQSAHSCRYFAASCAHFASVLKNGCAAGGASISPVSDVRNGTMRP